MQATARVYARAATSQFMPLFSIEASHQFPAPDTVLAVSSSMSFWFAEWITIGFPKWFRLICLYFAKYLAATKTASLH